MTGAPERIRLVGVSKTFDTPTGPRTVLDDVHVTVRAGEVCGLIGRSGAGKSTLLRMVNGLERPTAGQVLLDGLDVAGLRGRPLRRVRQGTGMVFQQFALWGSRTVFGNVAVPLRLAGWSDARVATRVAELLDFVGLGDKAFERPARLSGGQKQRVGIARAIAAEPAVLLADEATSALDPQTTTEIVDLLRAVNRDLGLTVVVVSHEMDVVSRLADHVVVLAGGRVVEAGGIHQVLSRPRHPVTAALVGASSGAVAAGEGAPAVTGVEGRRLAVVVDERLVRDPLLSRLGREHHVDFAVVHGGVSRVKGQPYGRLGLSLFGAQEDVDRFVAAVRRHAEVVPW